MADVFISYKREDRAVAQQLSIALEQLGFDVWWDFDLLSGEPYRKVIRTVIDQCKAAIVLWSGRAVESDFVVDEATHAKGQGKLCPTRIDATPPPFGFGSLHTDDLSDWDGELSHPGFAALVRGIETKVGRKGRLGQERTTEAVAAHSELEAFKAAEIIGTPSALRSFLQSYPNGVFARFVGAQIESIVAQQQPSTRDPAHKRETQGAANVQAIGAAVLLFFVAIVAVESWYFPGVFEARTSIGFALPGSGAQNTEGGYDGYFVGWPDFLQFLASVGGGVALIGGLANRPVKIGWALGPALVNAIVWFGSTLLMSSLVAATLAGSPVVPQLAFHAMNVTAPIATAVAAYLMGKGMLRGQ